MQNDEPIDGIESAPSEPDGAPQVSVPPVTTPPLQQPPAQYPRSQYVQPAPNDDPLRFVIPVNPSGWAVAAGYLGLFSVLCVFAPIALFAGVMGLRDIKANPNKTGQGRAIFGIVMGSVGTIAMLAIGIMSIMQKK